MERITLSALTDLSEQEDGNSRFELKLETVAVTLLCQAEVGKRQTSLKLKLCTV